LADKDSEMKLTQYPDHIESGQPSEHKGKNACKYDCQTDKCIRYGKDNSKMKQASQKFFHAGYTAIPDLLLQRNGKGHKMSNLVGREGYGSTIPVGLLVHLLKK